MCNKPFDLRIAFVVVRCGIRSCDTGRGASRRQQRRVPGRLKPLPRLAADSSHSARLGGPVYRWCRTRCHRGSAGPPVTFNKWIIHELICIQNVYWQFIDLFFYWDFFKKWQIGFHCRCSYWVSSNICQRCQFHFLNRPRVNCPTRAHPAWNQLNFFLDLEREHWKL